MAAHAVTLASLALIFASSVSPAAAAADVGWDSLSSQLSSPVKLTDRNAWLEQCIKPFDAANRTLVEFWGGGVSNYDLFEKDSGLCMQEAACAFEKCLGIFYERYQHHLALTGVTFYQSELTELYEGLYPNGAFPVLTDGEILDAAAADSELPAAVVHPEHPGDVSIAIRFAAEHGLGVSVKTSGHNWMGASTKRGTLLLNLAKLKKFALPGTLGEGIFECSSDDAANPSVDAACRLALARGKPAVMRAGGGQVVNEGLQAVEAWNSVAGAPQYHAMVGAAGTVSLAGGWLFSGGLGGPLNMRMYGVGVDQVLHVEMVLPDGRFVRFGPSAWAAPQGDQLYPQTTEVTGFCNDGDLSDESQWNWVVCDDAVNFADLWFAVRGGGGGAYGVVTSIYYQLHTKPGSLETLDWLLTVQTYLFGSNNTIEDNTYLLDSFFPFLFKFLYSPSELGVSASVSRSCSSPDDGKLYCYDGAGQHFAQKWAEYGGVMPIEVKEQSSYAAERMAAFDGKIADLPYGHALFMAPGGANPIVIPLDVIRNKLDAFVAIYVPCLYESWVARFSGLPIDDPAHCMLNTPYFYGGNVQQASDGMDAYPAHRRNGAFHIFVLRPNVSEALRRLIWDVPADEQHQTGDTFPGLYCHNHLFPGTSPHKSNWLEDCRPLVEGGTPLSDEDCMSLQEASFGTETLRRLEEIHTSIDPNRLFEPVDGPGYAEVSAISGSERRASAWGVALAVLTILSLWR